MKFAATVIVLFVCFLFGRGMFWLPTIPNHEGDGVFENLSRRGGLFVAIPGYSITMPEFDLANPYQAEYRLGSLTNVGRKCGVHLAIRDHDGRLGKETERLAGRLQLVLLTSQGQEVVRVSGRLGDYIWWGFSNLHVLYQMDKSFFSPNIGDEYRLRFSYEPDRRLAGYRGFVYVRSGGGK